MIRVFVVAILSVFIFGSANASELSAHCVHRLDFSIENHVGTMLAVCGDSAKYRAGDKSYFLDHIEAGKSILTSNDTGLTITWNEGRNVVLEYGAPPSVQNGLREYTSTRLVIPEPLPGSVIGLLIRLGFGLRSWPTLRK